MRGIKNRLDKLEKQLRERRENEDGTLHFLKKMAADGDPFFVEMLQLKLENMKDPNYKNRKPMKLEDFFK